ASFVTPFIVRYADRQPWVWALELLPAYDAVARVKNGAHWQTDVMAGWALGTGFGYFEAKNKSPFFLTILPHSVTIGVHSTFSVGARAPALIFVAARIPSIAGYPWVPKQKTPRLIRGAAVAKLRAGTLANQRSEALHGDGRYHRAARADHLFRVPHH